MRQQVSSYRMLGWISRGVGVILLTASLATAEASITKPKSDGQFAKLFESVGIPLPGIRPNGYYGDSRDGSLGTELGSGKEELQALALSQGLPFGDVLEDALATYLSRMVGRVYTDGVESWRVRVNESKDVETARKDFQRQAELEGWDTIKLGRHDGIKLDRFSRDAAETLAREYFATKFLYGNMLVDIEMRGRASAQAVSPAAEMVNRLKSLRLMN